MFIFGLIWSWLTSSGIGQLTAAYTKYKDSQVESERTQAAVLKTRLDNALETQRLSQQVRLATSGFWEMRLITFLIAFPFVAHLWWVWLDTQFKFGWRVNAFPDPFDKWEGAILLSFFGIGVVGMGIKAVASAVIARRR